jgi:glycosyltransferase involved in cell wall biosynthesis
MSLRVCILQPIVPRYRVPVFSMLARQPGIELEVWASLTGAMGSIAGITSSDAFTLKHASYAERCGVVVQPAAIRAVRSGFDAVIITDNVRSPAMFAALALRKSPVIIWGHGFGTHHDRMGHRLRMMSFRSADAGLFYGPRGRDRFVKEGIDPGKLFVAPNAIDQAPIAAACGHWREGDRLASFRREQGIDGPFILYLSRLEPEKLPLMAIDALVELRKGRPDLRLVFIGDGSARSAIERRVRDEGLGDAVRLVGALYEDSDIAPWALSAELLIHPGALGLSIFHAFGYGLPVVTTDSAAIQMPEVECLEPGRNGLMYRHGDLGDLVSCCARILDDRSTRAALSAGATQTVTGPGGRNLPAMVQGFVDAIRFVTSR